LKPLILNIALHIKQIIMKVYLVFKEKGIDGIDISSVRVFEEERDAIAYSIALETHKDYYKDYYTVEILLTEVI
jgi:hypothetical protein